MPNQKPGSTPVVGAVFAPPTQHQQVIPEVERMRRGRPPSTSQQQPPAAAASAAAAAAVAQRGKPSRSPAKVTNGDPFAALDAKSAAGPGDELSSRFPTLDQFSILHDSGSKFDFDSPISPPAAQQEQQPRDISRKVTERLADDAFAPPRGGPAHTPSSQRPSSEVPRQKVYPSASMEAIPSGPAKSASAPLKAVEMSRASAIISSSPELQAISSQTTQPMRQPTPAKPVMVSTGTMTSDSPPERPPSTQYQVYRFPPADQHRSTSLPRRQDASSSDIRRSDTPNASRLGVTQNAPPFQAQSGHARHASSSRPSLEGGRPDLGVSEPMTSSRSAASVRTRPVSAHLDSGIDYSRDREALPKPLISPRYSPKYAEKEMPPPPEPDDETNITSNVEFLRSMEDSDPKKKDKSAHKHGKRSSLTSLGTGTKNILAGKFGDAFKRFEANTGPPAPPRTPSPLKNLDRRDLTPIAGSEATDGRSDDGNVLEDTDDMSPEMRREIERRRLSEEEARVAAAAAEYRQRVQKGSTGPTPLPKSIGGVSRAVSIQNKVQSLLDESSRSTVNAPRTAQGYGHYSDAAQTTSRPPTTDDRPAVPRKPVGGSEGPGLARPIPAGGAPKPMAPPKPTHLNKNLTANSMPTGGRPGSPPKPSMPSSSINVPRVRGPGQGQGLGSREHLVAVDLPGQPTVEMTVEERDDYIRDFQKRFPSLTSIEMVERDLAAEADARTGR